MYRQILIPVENAECDQTIIDHIRPLAKLTGAKLLLMHVADGFAARNFDQLSLQESEEMRGDRSYLDGLVRDLENEGFSANAILAMGNPATEIIRVSREQNVDLIAMATHGHKFIGDLIHGTTANKVRHEVDVPVLLLKAPRK